jgi:mannosyltransferase
MNKINNWIKSNYIVLLILVVATGLRFYHIDYQSVWLDEICSILEANPDIKWSDLEATIMVSDPHPPLYFALMKILFQLFGYTTLVARVFSAIVGVGGVYALYLLGKEINNKNTGLLAAFLLAINSFHIYYSQEVRMYALLVLLTVLSYYKLVVYLKENTYKNAILYGLFTGLMLLTQFFGLFVLVSQVIILLFVFIKKEKPYKLLFFKQLIASGLVIIISFLPALNIFIETTKKKYTAIQPTTIDTVFLIFKDFVQQSYILLFLYSCLIVVCIYYALKEKMKQNYLLLFSWIIITLALPILRSYLVTPMIVSRYFITILPAFIILVSIAILKFKYTIIKISLLLFLTTVTFYELVIFNDYYNKIAKTQFREITEFIKKENKENDQVVSNLNWYLTFFFNKKQDTQVVEAGLENHIQEMIINQNKVISFWYFGAFGTYFNITPEAQAFLDEKFILAHSLDQFDSWTKHYVIKSEENVKEYKIPLNSITLSNINDGNWTGGVSKINQILLVDYSDMSFEKLNKSKFIITKSGKKLHLDKIEKVGNYIHLYVNQNVITFAEEVKYPTVIEIF